MKGERQHQKQNCGFYFRQQQIEENNIFQNILQIHHELEFKSFVNNINCQMSKLIL